MDFRIEDLRLSATQARMLLDKETDPPELPKGQQRFEDNKSGNFQTIQ